jgi:antirestriction protein
MNTEKIEKLKKTLNSTKLPADLKPKIEAEIKRLEDLDAKESEAKEEVKPVAKKTTTRKPRATKTVAKKTSTRKPSQTSKPKRTPMSLAKEIRKEGESWSDARARASKMMKEKTHTATKDVESELDKLTKLVRGKKELKGQIGRTNLLIDAKRKAKPMGRRISKDGNVYYENRANRTDRGTYGKYHLAEGGGVGEKKYNMQFNTGKARYVINTYDGVKKHKDGSDFYDIHIFKTKPMFEEFQRKLIKEGYKYAYAEGGGVGRGIVLDKFKGQRPNNRHYSLEMFTNPDGLDYFRLYDDTSNEILAQSYDLEEVKLYAEMFKGKRYAEGGYLTDPNFGNFQNTMFAKGGGVRTINGREYSYGRNWTNDHNLTNKGEEHEVNYTRKKRFELGGTVVTDLAGHTGGGTGGLNAGMPLDGFSNTGYTGLVGETGAMSSGEMFMSGGSIDKNFDLSGYKKFRTFNDLEEAKQYVDMDRKKYPRVKESVVIKEGNRFQVWVVPATGIETGNRVYELGGGLPSGVSQSYMITESLGNPAQHFAKGGGIRRVGGREYPLGRNWTNDHEHVNKGEEHEVNYTRKGKFLGIFKDGGGIPNNYEGKTPEQVWNMWTPDQREHFLADHYDVMDGKDLDAKNKSFKSLNFLTQTQLELHIKQGQYAKGGGVRRVGNREYSLGRNWTNDHEHVNKAEEHETKYTRKKSFAGGGAIGETPKIYVADLEAYNNGRLSGVWLDLADYNDADELMEAIQDFLNTTGGEEYAIHDAEYIPSSMYSEYMGQRDFEELYEMIDLAKDNNLPLSVVQEVVSQYDASAVEEFQGRYDSAEDFAQQLVDDIGIESFTDFQYYLEVSDTDRRLLAQDMADSYVDDIRDEDGGNRLIEEAGLDVDEYEEADSDRQEEMLDEAREIVYDEYYNNWFEGLSDPYYFLVEEQGMYSPDDFANANFVRVDYEKLGDALEQDYTFIYDDGELYVFNIR